VTRRCVRILDTPIGPLTLAGDGEALEGVHLPVGGRPAPPPGPWLCDPGAFAEAAAQLEAYFDGRRTTFDLPVRLRGTPFQEQVWHVLRSIPFGTTTTYGAVARRLGRPGAARAVGRANHANPVAIVVPCHRVIGADGSLTGYGGGLDTKAWLLAHERAVRDRHEQRRPGGPTTQAAARAGR